MRSFICSIIPNELVARLKGQQAANNFCGYLIDNGVFDHVFSLVPPHYFNDSIKNSDKIIYFYGAEKTVRCLKILKLIINNVNCAWKSKNSDNIWFYNICNTNLLCYIILRYIFKKNVYAILLDYTPVSNVFSFSHYFPFLYKNSKGLISLSDRIGFEHSNMSVKAGVIAKEKIKPLTINISREYNFLFCGNMGEHTGFPLAIEVFKELPNINLFISGKAACIDVDYSKYPNIHYLGYMEYDDFLKLYDKVDVCLSFRNPSFPENSYNFPSKILEYFCYNKIVISTMKYKELNGFDYILVDYNKDSVIKMIKKIVATSKQEMALYIDNRKALKSEFSVESWLKCICLIESRS